MSSWAIHSSLVSTSPPSKIRLHLLARALDSSSQKLRKSSETSCQRTSRRTSIKWGSNSKTQPQKLWSLFSSRTSTPKTWALAQAESNLETYRPSNSTSVPQQPLAWAIITWAEKTLSTATLCQAYPTSARPSQEKTLEPQSSMTELQLPCSVASKRWAKQLVKKKPRNLWKMKIKS
jgi:hypothetical protein